MMLNLFSILAMLFSVTQFCNAQTLIETANEKLQQEKYYDSLVLLEQALRKDSFNIDALQLYVKVNRKLDRLSEALWALYKLEEVSPKSCSVQNQIGNFFSSYGMLDSAIVRYDLGFKLALDSVEISSTHLNKGTTYAIYRKYDMALIDLNKALEFYKSDIHLLNNIATIYAEVKDFEKSIGTYKKILKRDSLFEGAHVNLGLLYAEIDSLNKAELHLKTALDLISEEPYLLNNFGYLKYKQHQYDKALEYINKSINLEPNNSYAYRNRALVYLDLNLYEEACKELIQADKKGFEKFYGEEVKQLFAKYCKE